MIEVRQTVVFERWLRDLRNIQAKARINARIRRVSLGLIGDVKPVGDGVVELRIDYGPGYRLYFTRRGEAVLLLLVGGDKGGQDRDIRRAKQMAMELDWMGIATTRWDVTEHLDSEEAIAAYLDAVFEDGAPELIKAAIGDLACARGMTEIARKAGITRAGLYKALADTGNPSFTTIASVMKALGVRLSVTTAS